MPSSDYWLGAMPLFEKVDDLRFQADRIRARRYGLIVMEDGYLSAIHLRPWPKLLSAPDILGAGRRFDERAAGDRCWLYYNQPCRHPRFLALKYIVSSRAASFRTFRGSLVILDEIARLKGTDAILAEVRNLRITDRLLRRWGWEPHVPSSRRRHFIKRFYGNYPDSQPAWEIAARTSNIEH